MAAISVQEDGGGDYTTLEAAVENAATIDGDVITITETWSASEATQIAVADALTIQATGDSKHIGRPHSGSETTYRHRNTASGHSFTITDTGTVTFIGLDIQNTSTTTSDEVFRNNVSNTFIAQDCVLGFASRNSEQDIYYNEALATATFESCHFYNANRAVVDLFQPDAGSVVNINSCTGYDIGYNAGATTRSGLVGVRDPASTCTVNIFNTIVHINTGTPVTSNDDADTVVNIHTLITNATSISNITLDTDTNNVTSATITDSTASTAYILNDVTTSPFDLRVTDHANNTAQDNHTNGTGTGTGLSVPSSDIVGTSRPQNTNYDIGAFEIVSGATSALTGTATATIDENDITTGGKTIIITLTGDTFKAAGTGPIGSTADTQALIDGIVSAQSETNGWNAVRSGIATSDVARTSDSVATLTLPALGTYDITAQETLTDTVPTAVLVIAAGAIVATPTFTIDAVSGFQAAWARNSNTVIQVGM